MRIGTKETLENKAKALLAAMTTPALIEAFEATDHDNREDIPTVRGWIMDELERRDPVAFEAWMLTDGAPGPQRFFNKEGQ